ncbi:FAD-binding and (Fe-S)-binding domain-containing protein [Sporomusa sp.]|uniref:FAD-binding and (Fe-S)-binding domain-containing protein n=1 Tax=Sporomusa sp. TaxID=2078658 RepID=UPI002D0DA35F|nr:FAD-binding and (Fe-S)-binding domain-containing protein [Sporomusa sp.]HWR06599.1 FAD-binding and (Fe-S)-binding domain-containing protein [Sporomusa sp.]
MRTVKSDILNLPENYRKFYEELITFIPANHIFADPIRTLAYGVDASLYRITPKLVVKVRTSQEVAEIFKIAGELRIATTIRAAGTSLSGQALTDSVLLLLAGGWSGYQIDDQGETIMLEPGIIGSEANQYLRPYSRKIGPDPASINYAMIGGIAANNASGMCCGTADNSYKTIAAMKIIFADGAILDTADPDSCEHFISSHQQLIGAIENIRDEINADQQLRQLIVRKFKIKNTTGYGINAFVDYHNPIDIISHLMIGSEGTLGFIAEITYKTVVEHAHKASALMFFPDMKQACMAVMRLERPLVAAAELLDRISLRSVEDSAGMPAFLKELDEQATALLVEIRALDKATLDSNIEKTIQCLADIPVLFPIAFTDKKTEYETLWKIRAGVFPAVGGIRRQGTSVIIEDVAFPKELLAEGVLALRECMNRHGYGDGVIYGHALDGNVHFVFNQNFDTLADISRYKGFINEVCSMVVERFSGSLKAEHGTGRNMAPFVELEWGQQAYKYMKQIKQAFDPEALLNPDVVITDNPDVYVENLKIMPQVHELVDKCMECGFCEINCPSLNLTSSPRQRIAVQRELARLRAAGTNKVLEQRVEEDYDYFGEITCATDGLCQTTCPLAINTGSFTKYLRSTKITSRGRRTAKFMAEHFGGITSLAKLGLAGAHLAHQTLGTCTVGGLAKAARSVIGESVPKWNKWLPKASARLEAPPAAPPDSRKIVYFPSCVSRTMGPAKEDSDQRSLHQVMMSLLNKAGYGVIFPPGMEELCCGMPFESKGYFDAADELSAKLEQVLLECSNNGQYPVLCDTSPCVYRMKRVMDQRLTILDTVDFIHDYLLNELEFKKSPEKVAIHVTCSATKMGLAEKFRAVAEACATEVIIPDKVKCCGFAGDKGFEVPELNESALAHLKESIPSDCNCGFSNSRTCEIGLADHSGISYQSIAVLVDRCCLGRKKN